MTLLLTILPLALVVGLSPLPIVPLLVLLTGDGGLRNAWSYLIAWLMALTGLVTLVVVLGLSVRGDRDAPGIEWARLITGLVLLAFAAFKILRSRRESSSKTPKWLVSLQAASPATAARLGATFASLNPKNIVMAVAAGAEIALYSQGAGDSAVAVAVFVLVGSLGVATPVLLGTALGDRAEPALLRGREWLIRHNAAVSAGILAVLGVLLVLSSLNR